MFNVPASYLEVSILHPCCLLGDVETTCKKAIAENFAAVCVPPLFVKAAKTLTKDTPVKVATVAGFPFGYAAIEAKLSEIVLAIVDGADELNMMVNLTAIKNNDWQYLARELNAIMPVVRAHSRTFKINIEAGLLTRKEILQCCDLYGIAGVDYLETATGFATQQPGLSEVILIRQHLADSVAIKATLGSLDPEFQAELLEAGVTRIGYVNEFVPGDAGMVFDKNKPQ